jgi:uncharacterized protein (DUF58 family)
MIVPRTRMLFVVGLVVIPGAAVASLVPEMSAMALVLIGAVLGAAMVDLALSKRGLKDLELRLPAVTRLFKDREGMIELTLRNPSQRPRRLRFGLPLPREIHSHTEDLPAILPQGAERSRLNWPCLPLRRGSYRLDSCMVETESPLGLWAGRMAKPISAEIRVYSNLLSERKQVSALFLNRGRLGIHALRQVGKGRDFEKLREYIPGDSFEDIHWKATAKRGRPVTKVFQIERTQEVYVILDASRLTAREIPEMNPPRERAVKGSGDEPIPDSRTTILERFITAGLILGVAAEQQGDLFGLVTFSDRVQRFVRARNGASHYNTCRDALYTLHPQLVAPDFDELCSFIRLRLRRRALLIFLTALEDPVAAESFVRNMNLICRQHLIVVNMMQQPGIRPLFADDTVASLDDLYRHLGGHVLWHNLRELDKTLQRRGVRFSLVENEKLSAELVSQYLNLKQRQLL